MPFPGFQLCHRQPPDACSLNAGGLVKECGDTLKRIEKSFPRAWCLKLCQSSARGARRQLLERFEFPTHQEGARVLARDIYLLFDGNEATRENAFYVGVANDVPKRLTNRLSATSHHQSSLLYLLMKRHLPEDALLEVDEENGKRSPRKREALFRDHLLDNCSVVMHPDPDIATLHVLEALAALEFRTGPWNSFRPH